MSINKFDGFNFDSTILKKRDKNKHIKNSSLLPYVAEHHITSDNQSVKTLHESHRSILAPVCLLCTTIHPCSLTRVYEDTQNDNTDKHKVSTLNSFSRLKAINLLTHSNNTHTRTK